MAVAGVTGWEAADAVVELGGVAAGCWAAGMDEATGCATVAGAAGCVVAVVLGWEVPNAACWLAVGIRAA